MPGPLTSLEMDATEFLLLTFFFIHLKSQAEISNLRTKLLCLHSSCNKYQESEFLFSALGDSGRNSVGIPTIYGIVQRFLVPAMSVQHE